MLAKYSKKGCSEIMDWFIIVCAVAVLIISQVILHIASKKPPEWQEQNKALVKRYTYAQYALIVLFIIYLIISIVQKIY